MPKDYGITREEADAFAVRSHQHAAAAWDAGKFDDELVPVAVPQRKGDPLVFAQDEGFRADASMESLGKLARARRRRGHRGQRQPAERRRRRLPRRRRGQARGTRARADRVVHRLGRGGLRPSRMGIGPVPAVERLFARTGIGWDDIDLVELNEAFAPQVLAVLKGWGWSDDDSRRTCSTSTARASRWATRSARPAGASSPTWRTRCARREVRYGLETMCIGGGQGIAAVFERAA